MASLGVWFQTRCNFLLIRWRLAAQLHIGPLAYMIPLQIFVALTAFATFSAKACPPPRDPPTFQEQLAQSYGRADSAFEAKVMVNEHLPGPSPAGTDHIRLKVVQRFKGKPSAAALDIRVQLSGTTCDRPYFESVGSHAVVFSGADGQLIWTVRDQTQLAEALKYLQASAKPGQ